jgi:crotonobetainyl-CoA:carnitine CoA-transferase CaiB-like acyl-CoA transferase
MGELKTHAEIEAAMDKMNLAWGPVRDPATLRDQVTVRHRGTIVEIDDRAGGKRTVVQSPYRFSNAKSGVRGPAPHRGEHNQTVLAEWLDTTPAAVAELTRDGVLHRAEDDA